MFNTLLVLPDLLYYCTCPSIVGIRHGFKPRPHLLPAPRPHSCPFEELYTGCLSASFWLAHHRLHTRATHSSRSNYHTASLNVFLDVGALSLYSALKMQKNICNLSDSSAISVCLKPSSLPWKFGWDHAAHSRIISEQVDKFSKPVSVAQWTNALGHSAC